MSDILVRTVVTQWVPERTTPFLRARFVDHAGAVIPALDSATLQIHLEDGTEVRAIGSILDHVTAGELAMHLTAEDTRVLGQEATEKHVALLTWTWDGGAKTGRHEVVHTVANLAQVP